MSSSLSGPSLVARPGKTPVKFWACPPPVSSLLSRSRKRSQPQRMFSWTTRRQDSVKERTMEALSRGVRVVIGSSGLTAADFSDIDRTARERKLGVIAAGNFSLTAALAKHLALLAAQYLPSWEVIDYAAAEKVDAPSGTTRELAEALGEAGQNKLAIPVERTHGEREARGATI